jgi:methylphosphotriester-DNA--protein-cysteine methyltransferase
VDLVHCHHIGPSKAPNVSLHRSEAEAALHGGLPHKRCEHGGRMQHAVSREPQRRVVRGDGRRVPAREW